VWWKKAVVKYAGWPVGEVAQGDGGESGVVQVAAAEPVQGRGEPGDRGGDERPPGPEHLPGLPQGRQAIHTTASRCCPSHASLARLEQA
jgi:hypothetical protein